MTQCLIVVPRERPDLWGELVQRHSAAADVEIILDRRAQDREPRGHPRFHGAIVRGQFLAVTRW